MYTLVAFWCPPGTKQQAFDIRSCRGWLSWLSLLLMPEYSFSFRAEHLRLAILQERILCLEHD